MTLSNGMVGGAQQTVQAAVDRSGTFGAWTVRFESEAVPGTLAVFAGVLSLRRLDIVSALIRKTAEGRVIDTFEVHPLEGADFSAADAPGLAEEAVAAMNGANTLGVQLRALRQRYPATETTLPIIEVMTDSSLTTGVKVRAADRPGLLYDIASTLTAHCLRTRSVTALTFGGHAYDTFRVVDSCGEPPQGERELAALVADLERVCRP